MIALSRLLTSGERERLDDDAVSRGYWRSDHRIFKPGWGWYEPWYWNPREAARLGVTDWPSYCAKFPNHEPFHGGGLLSRFYWERWSKIRPPICVVLPNGEQWEIDRKSSNGDGWDVQGTWPNLVCTPSINAKGYHGWLGSQGAPPGHFVDVPMSYPYPETWHRVVQFDTADPRMVYTETLPGNPLADYRCPTPAGGLIYCDKPA